ncbi:MAG: aldehyde-activating protein [Alphaproteobacteria bacterium]|nr:MAG: aldehyde-activating protein [Alphaproteobacteria bacterium]
MCGECRMRVSIAPVMTMACHCKGCQKLSASAFSLTAMVPADGFELIKGRTQIGALRGDNPYHYCVKCLNWLYTSLASAPFVNVRPTMFDVPTWSTPFIESYVGEKLSWATTSAPHGFAKFPEAHQYGPLMAEYAAWSAAQ